MIIKKYGLTLERLQEKDIELVRRMRNKKSIAEKMFYQQEISPAQQKEWFSSIHNKYNYYFLIIYKGEKIGLIHGKIRSFSEGLAEGGIFLWKENYYQTHLPLIASICMADLTFLIMKMKKTLAEVRSDNVAAVAYNRKLGYRVVAENTAEKRLKMELTRENYFRKAAPWRDRVKRIAQDSSDLSWDDIQLAVNDADSELYQGLPDYLQREIEAKLGR